RTLARPDFPLRRALCDKHLESGYSFDAAPRRKLQKLRLPRSVNRVEYQPAIQFARFERRASQMRMHSNRGCINDRIEKLALQPRPDHRLAAHGFRKSLRSLAPPRAHAPPRASLR